MLPLPYRSEDLLQYAWQHRRFVQQGLHTTAGQPLTIVKPGHQNTGQGPDFEQAHIRIDGMDWHGAVEVHLHGKGWYEHGHHTDEHYNRVVLHVVLQPSNQPPLRQDGSSIPELVLDGLLDDKLTAAYSNLHAAGGSLPCQAYMPTLDKRRARRWVESLAMARLIAKAEELGELLEHTGSDWPQLFWIALAAGTGAKANRHAFTTLAQGLPFRLLRSVSDDAQILEALLLGRAGLLSKPVDVYTELLHQHWAHYATMHDLQPMAAGQLKTGGMRPASQPALRLAQLAALLHAHAQPMNLLEGTLMEVMAWLTAEPSPYWRTHYTLGKPTPERPKPTGMAFRHTLVINTLVPFGVLYYRRRSQPTHTERLMDWLHELPSEANRITRLYTQHGYKPKSALESQGLLHLQRHYCQPINCLRCGIGHQIISPAYAKPKPSSSTS